MTRFFQHSGLACLALLGALALARSAAPAQPAETQRSTPVLLITIDTLRADRLSCYGARTVRTPVMDALAAQGVRFENALSQVPITPPSHTVILSGTYPMYNGMRDFTNTVLSPKIGLISQAFKRHGYITAAFVSAFVLDSSWGFGRGFSTYDDQFDTKQYETRNPGNIQRRGGVTIDHLLAWLRAYRSGPEAAKPFFVWLHLYDPHSDYNPPEPFHTEYAGHLYDGEVAYVDSQLGRLFNVMKQDGWYDPALIVLVSDHGESLGEHGEAEHGFFIYDSTLHVPMIFKLPHAQDAGRVISSPVGLIDVAPTLFDLLHLQDPLSRQFQGASLASLILGKTDTINRPVYSETYYPRDSFGWSALHSLTTPQYHYIQAPKPELYAWPADPGEKHNLYAEHRADAQSLQEELRDIERRYTATTTSETGPPLSQETIEKLKSLGYVAYSAPAAPAASGAPLADPKDRLAVFNAILHSTDLASAGRFAESDALLEKIEKQEPRLYLIPFMLAENAAKERRWPQAETQFMACLKLNPSFEQALMGLSRAYFAEEKFGQARPWLEVAVHNNPRNFMAYYALGMIARADHLDNQANEYLARSVAIKSDYAPAQQELGILLVETRKYAEALDPLRRAAELGPENPLLDNYLGIAYSNTGKMDQGVQWYQKALALKADYPVARLNLAFAYLKMGQRANATKEYHTVCQESAATCRQYQSVFESPN